MSTLARPYPPPQKYPSHYARADAWLVARLAEVLPSEAHPSADRWTNEAAARGLVLSTAAN
jgi:hypothetical protein